MAIPNRRGPRALSDILGELFTVRGYGRFLARQELEDAWNAAVGEPLCRQTQLGEVRRGVLNVTVSHPALLEELAAFRKPELLAALRTGAPGTTIHDIRFRVGVPGSDAGPDPPAAASAGGPLRRGGRDPGPAVAGGRGPAPAGRTSDARTEALRPAGPSGVIRPDATPDDAGRTDRSIADAPDPAARAGLAASGAATMVPAGPRRPGTEVRSPTRRRMIDLIEVNFRWWN